MKYSNPRTKAIIEDWPIGSGARGTAIFEVEQHPKRGQRISRVTEKRDGSWGKPKYSTYSERCAIVDGDDGKTYCLHWTSQYGRQLGVMQGNMKYSEETLFPEHEGYDELLQLLENMTPLATL